MKKEDIQISDIHRILVGEAPVMFLAEVLLRTVIIYLFLLLIVRWLGKRMSGQLTITELSVMILMGAIVSAPMEMPERGILQGVVILVMILLLHQGLTWLEVKYKKVELITQGIPKMLVSNGVIRKQELEHVQISKDQLFNILRGKSIYNLGRVKRVYLETCGKFSVYEYEQPRPGLSVFPPDEDTSTMQEVQDTLEACSVCGYTRDTEGTAGACPNCSHDSWEAAVL